MNEKSHDPSLPAKELDERILAWLDAGGPRRLGAAVGARAASIVPPLSRVVLFVLGLLCLVRFLAPLFVRAVGPPDMATSLGLMAVAAAICFSALARS